MTCGFCQSNIHVCSGNLSVPGNVLNWPAVHEQQLLFWGESSIGSKEIQKSNKNLFSSVKGPNTKPQILEINLWTCWTLICKFWENSLDILWNKWTVFGTFLEKFIIFGTVTYKIQNVTFSFCKRSGFSMTWRKCAKENIRGKAFAPFLYCWFIHQAFCFQSKKEKAAVMEENCSKEKKLKARNQQK